MTVEANVVRFDSLSLDSGAPIAMTRRVAASQLTHTPGTPSYNNADTGGYPQFFVDPAATTPASFPDGTPKATTDWTECEAVVPPGHASATIGDATLKLPVQPGAAYTLTLWLLMRDNTPPETVSAPGASAPIAPGRNQRVVLAIPASATKDRHTITVKLSGTPWSPSKLIPGSSDARLLGARVFAVEMKAAQGPAQPQVLN